MTCPRIDDLSSRLQEQIDAADLTAIAQADRHGFAQLDRIGIERGRVRVGGNLAAQSVHRRLVLIFPRGGRLLIHRGDVVRSWRQAVEPVIAMIVGHRAADGGESMTPALVILAVELHRHGYRGIAVVEADLARQRRPRLQPERHLGDRLACEGGGGGCWGAHN